METKAPGLGEPLSGQEHEDVKRISENAASAVRWLSKRTDDRSIKLGAITSNIRVIVDTCIHLKHTGRQRFKALFPGQDIEQISAMCSIANEYEFKPAPPYICQSLKADLAKLHALAIAITSEW